MYAGVSCVMEPEEYKDMSDDALYECICRELYVDEYQIEDQYFHKKSAEYLERAIYVCPDCGLSEFESAGDLIHCKKCGKQIRYRSDKKLEGVGCEFPFSTVTEWYRYQIDFVNGLDYTKNTDALIYEDRVDLSEVILYQGKNLLRENASFRLYGDRFVLDEGSDTELVLPFTELSVVTVLGKNKLNIYHGDKVYQIKGSERLNSLKYMNFRSFFKSLV